MTGRAGSNRSLSARETVQADDQETVRGYLVQVQFATDGLEQGWTLIPYACFNDADLNDATLIVDDVQLGTERFTRDLICSHTQA